MKKIYDVIRKDYNLYDDKYAEAGIRGTYIKNPPCPKCRGGRWERILPLIIEWEPGSDVIADFTWPCGLEVLVVAQRVKDCVEKHGLTGVSFAPVEMVQHPKLKKPTRPNARTKKRVWLPYDGEPLWELQVKSFCNLDLQQSRRSLTGECEVCQRRTYSIVPDAPLVVDSKTWDGSDFFRLRELDIVFVSDDDVRRVFETESFTNVQLKERGWVSA